MSDFLFMRFFYYSIMLLCIDNLFSSIKCNINMATDIVLAYNIIETCLVELRVNFLGYTRKNNLYTFLLTHLTKVSKVVDTCRVNKWNFTHTDDSYLWSVAKSCHNLLEAVTGTKEVRTIDFVYFNTLRNSKMLYVAKMHIAIFIVWINLIRDDMNICSF